MDALSERKSKKQKDSGEKVDTATATSQDCSGATEDSGTGTGQRKVPVGNTSFDAERRAQHIKQTRESVVEKRVTKQQSLAADKLAAAPAFHSREKGLAIRTTLHPNLNLGAAGLGLRLRGGADGEAVHLVQSAVYVLAPGLGFV